MAITLNPIIDPIWVKCHLFKDNLYRTLLVRNTDLASFEPDMINTCWFLVTDQD